MKTLIKLRSLFLILMLACSLFISSAGAQGAKGGEHADGGRQSTPEAQTSETKQAAEDENDVYRHSPMVKKIGSMFGMSVERSATAFEFLNFAILAVVVGGFLLKVLPKTFRDRTSVIQKQLVDARSATEEASARLNSVEDRLAKLDGQIAAMKDQAEKDAAADEVRIKATVEDEKKKILAAADQEIAAASVQAQRQLQRYAAELAIDQAARKLVVSAETDRLLVQGFVRRLSGDESKGGEN